VVEELIGLVREAPGVALVLTEDELKLESAGGGPSVWRSHGEEDNGELASGCFIAVQQIEDEARLEGGDNTRGRRQWRFDGAMLAASPGGSTSRQIEQSRGG
jgi:hypothetical protein